MWALLAVAFFFSSAMLAVHVATDDAGSSGAFAAGVAPPEPLPGAVPLPNELAPGDDALGVFPEPARTAELDACVERIMRASGSPEALKPTAPGRWPALKRAREQLRQKRLIARADCERELGGDLARLSAPQ